MKNGNIIYYLSLAILFVAIVLITGFSDSGRMQLIAGGLLPIGFVLNILAYALKKGK